MDRFSLPTQEQISKLIAQSSTTSALLKATAPSRIGPTIAIQNLSTILSDATVQAAVAALQIQLDRDWQAAWGTTATLMFYTRSQTIPSTYWPIYLLDTTDTAGALGYHDELVGGRPYGRIFAKTAAQYGYSWTVTLSHELLEMMADPYVNLTVFNQTTAKAGRIYAYEVGDPVEADAYGYTINGILVSDFVFPSWFDTYQTARGTRYDQTNRVTAPFQILPGGYMSVFNVSNGSGWTMITHNNIETAEPPLSDRNRWLRDD
jgi:hypothetical protein